METIFVIKPKHQRLLLIIAGLLLCGGAGFLAITLLSESLIFFYTPSELTHKYIHREQRIRLGGFVSPHSLQRKGEWVSFKITDHKETLDINYNGILPDLFREGQGVVAEGYLQEPGFFKADSILAKHDENYMPKAVADRLN